ncbi:signal peptidase I [Intrasporangium calvum]|uniref:Signal peptidase I n=1 Tax=Intrasporangium calvum TaxID=53358 RepID=A0ABT5GMI4_9MICO|nr:signal peptidase I [Intrasporangium calvum]MDC5699392.1 signal peptidase I [Intrasporangium calvum]
MSTTPAATSHRRRGVRVVAILTNVLLGLVTLAGLAYLAPGVLGYERYVITGGSMSGTFEKGALVLERVVPVEDLVVGDIITYVPPASSGVTTLVTHRITEISTSDTGSRVLRTKGDANADVDPWSFSLTAPTQPVVEVAVPHVGWALIALADRQWRMFAVGVPAGLVALYSLVQLVGALIPSRRRPQLDPAPH